jgi:Uma2 family endonuclease
VKEYWIVAPESQFMQVYTLVDGKYQPSKLLTLGDEIITPILPGFVLKLDDVFANLD